MTEMLRAEGLEVWLPQSGAAAPVVRNVDLTVRAGEILCLIGESGCGKTTTALALTGLLPEGSRVAFKQLAFAGRQAADLADAARWRGRGIAHIFQDAGAHLDPLYPIGAQLRETLTMTRGRDKRTAAQETRRLLERVGLVPAGAFERFYPHQLSGGMNQRVMVALALACGPRVLVADEPTTGLDPALREAVAGMIKQLTREQDWGVLWITHDVRLAEKTADRAAVMYAGSIVEEGRADAVFQTPQHPYTQALLACRPENLGRRKK